MDINHFDMIMKGVWSQEFNGALDPVSVTASFKAALGMPYEMLPPQPLT